MNNHKLTDWQVYWKIYDELIDLLDAEDKPEIVSDFKAAKSCVNGLTEGWYDYKIAIRNAMTSNRQRMSEEEIYLADFLIRTLDKSPTVEECINGK
jgi:hypothetical protein